MDTILIKENNNTNLFVYKAYKILLKFGVQKYRKEKGLQGQEVLLWVISST